MVIVEAGGADNTLDNRMKQKRNGKRILGATLMFKEQSKKKGANEGDHMTCHFPPQETLQAP